MSVLKLLGANAPATGNQTLYQIINGLGLTTNLKLCLDSGDSASYNSTVQTDKWLDTSGGGFDFWRGTGSGTQTSDPTFNGTAGGLSSSEYWSFDGGDFFVYDTTPETWMSNILKNSAKYSIFAVFYPSNFTANQALFVTGVTDTNRAQFFITTGAVASMFVFNTADVLNQPSTATLNQNAWNVCAVTVDEVATTGSFLVNGSTNTFTSTYTSPTTSNSTACRIGARLAGAIPIRSGSRLACLAIFEGTALTSTNLTDLYNGIKGRFGL